MTAPRCALATVEDYTASLPLPLHPPPHAVVERTPLTSCPGLQALDQRAMKAGCTQRATEKEAWRVCVQPFRQVKENTRDKICFIICPDGIALNLSSLTGGLSSQWFGRGKIIVRHSLHSSSLAPCLSCLRMPACSLHPSPFFSLLLSLSRSVIQTKLLPNLKYMCPLI